MFLYHKAKEPSMKNMLLVSINLAYEIWSLTTKLLKNIICTILYTHYDMYMCCVSKLLPFKFYSLFKEI